MMSNLSSSIEDRSTKSVTKKYIYPLIFLILLIGLFLLNSTLGLAALVGSIIGIFVLIWPWINSRLAILKPKNWLQWVLSFGFLLTTLCFTCFICLPRLPFEIPGVLPPPAVVNPPPTAEPPNTPLEVSRYEITVVQLEKGQLLITRTLDLKWPVSLNGTNTTLTSQHIITSESEGMLKRAKIKLLEPSLVYTDANGNGLSINHGGEAHLTTSSEITYAAEVNWPDITRVKLANFAVGSYYESSPTPEMDDHDSAEDKVEWTIYNTTSATTLSLAYFPPPLNLFSPILQYFTSTPVFVHWIIGLLGMAGTFVIASVIQPGLVDPITSRVRQSLEQFVNPKMQSEDKTESEENLLKQPIGPEIHTQGIETRVDVEETPNDTLIAQDGASLQSTKHQRQPTEGKPDWVNIPTFIFFAGLLGLLGVIEYLVVARYGQDAIKLEREKAKFN